MIYQVLGERDYLYRLLADHVYVTCDPIQVWHPKEALLLYAVHIFNLCRISCILNRRICNDSASSEGGRHKAPYTRHSNSPASNNECVTDCRGRFLYNCVRNILCICLYDPGYSGKPWSLHTKQQHLRAKQHYKAIVRMRCKYKAYIVSRRHTAYTMFTGFHSSFY